MIGSLRTTIAPIAVCRRRLLCGRLLVQHGAKPDTGAADPNVRELCLAATVAPHLWQVLQHGELVHTHGMNLAMPVRSAVLLVLVANIQRYGSAHGSSGKSASTTEEILAPQGPSLQRGHCGHMRRPDTRAIRRHPLKR